VNRAFLNVLLMALLLGTAYQVVHVAWTPGPLDRAGGMRGGDFQQFYLGAWMIGHGEADQLYRGNRLQELQNTLGPIDNNRSFLYPHLFLYPPITPLLVVPLGWLPYAQATNIWWLLQGICFCVSGWLLTRYVSIPSGWRTTVWLALLAFYPVWYNVLRGQLSAVLLLILVAGFDLQRRGRPAAAAVALSLLAMKPQICAGIYLWLALRRDWRSLVAMTAGLACQLAAVVAILGPSVVVAYVESLPSCGRVSLQYAFSAWAEHGIAGSVQIALAPLGCPQEWGYRAGTLVQLLVAGWAGWMLHRVALADRSQGIANALQTNSGSDWKWQPTPQEQTCVVLFAMLLTPHLLTYDLVLLAPALLSLWSSPRWRLGIVLYLATCAYAIPLYEMTNISLVAVAALFVLYRLTRPVGIIASPPVAVPCGN
jgi:hypothetical protein